MRYLLLMRTAIVLALLAATAATARADGDIDDPEAAPPPPPPATPFDRGKFALGVYGGSQSALGQRYFGIGAGLGYFVLDGLELGLGGQFLFGDGPNIGRVTPSLRYVAQPLVPHSPVVPYVGVFYNRQFIGDDIADIDSVGTRGGLIYVSGKVLLGLGVAYERIVSECVTDCSSVYPDVTIAVSF
jgi:hypothetical protein